MTAVAVGQVMLGSLRAPSTWVALLAVPGCLAAGSMLSEVVLPGSSGASTSALGGLLVACLLGVLCGMARLETLGPLTRTATARRRWGLDAAMLVGMGLAFAAPVAAFLLGTANLLVHSLGAVLVCAGYGTLAMRLPISHGWRAGLLVLCVWVLPAAVSADGGSTTAATISDNGGAPALATAWAPWLASGLLLRIRWLER